MAKRIQRTYEVTDSSEAGTARVLEIVEALLRLDARRINIAWHAEGAGIESRRIGWVVRADLEGNEPEEPGTPPPEQ